MKKENYELHIYHFWSTLGCIHPKKMWMIAHQCAQVLNIQLITKAQTKGIFHEKNGKYMWTRDFLVNGQVDQLCRLDALATSQGDKGCVEVEKESSNEETMAPKFRLLMPSNKLRVLRCPNITIEGLNKS
jgi:hypothetical protein